MKTILIILFLLVLLDGMSQHHNSIDHPDNEEFVVEVAFNLGICVDDVTQREFDERYSDTVIVRKGVSYLVYMSDPERPISCYINGKFEEFWTLKDLLAFIDKL